MLLQQQGLETSLRRVEPAVTSFVDGAVEAVREGGLVTAQEFATEHGRSQERLLEHLSAEAGADMGTDLLGRRLVAYPVLFDAISGLKTELREEITKMKKRDEL